MNELTPNRILSQEQVKHSTLVIRQLGIDGNDLYNDEFFRLDKADATKDSLIYVFNGFEGILQRN